MKSLQYKLIYGKPSLGKLKIINLILSAAATFFTSNIEPPTNPVSEKEVVIEQKIPTPQPKTKIEVKLENLVNNPINPPKPTPQNKLPISTTKPTIPQPTLIQPQTKTLEETVSRYFSIKQGNQWTYIIKIPENGKIGIFTRFDLSKLSIETRDFLAPTEGNYTLALEAKNATDSGWEIGVLKDDLGLYKNVDRVLWKKDNNKVLEIREYNKNIQKELSERTNKQLQNETVTSTSLLYVQPLTRDITTPFGDFLHFLDFSSLISIPVLYTENGETLVVTDEIRKVNIKNKSYNCQFFLQIPYEEKEAADSLLSPTSRPSNWWKTSLYFDQSGLVRKVQEDSKGNILNEMDLVKYKSHN